MNEPSSGLDITRFVDVAVIDDGKALADPVFLRRYKVEAPDFPFHVLVFARHGEQRGAVLGYIHFTAAGDFLLGGGACVDDRELRRLSPRAREAIREAGGLYRHALAWSVAHFSSRYKAVFGYCGDPLAERVDLSVGFAKTAHRHLLVHFTQSLDRGEQDRLIAEAHAVGPF